VTSGQFIGCPVTGLPITDDLVIDRVEGAAVQISQLWVMSV